MTEANPSFTILPMVNKLLHTQGGGIHVIGIVGSSIFEVQDATAFVYVQHGYVAYNSNWPLRAKQYGCFSDGVLSSSFDALALGSAQRRLSRCGGGSETAD